MNISIFLNKCFNDFLKVENVLADRYFLFIFPFFTIFQLSFVVGL